MVDELLDKENGLRWLKYDKTDHTKFFRIGREVNSWSGYDNISKYVSKEDRINDVFVMLAMSQDKYYDADIYYCFADSSQVPTGVVYLSNAKLGEPHAVIDTIVVNPGKQKSGIGSRMVKSITQNFNYFTYNPNTSKIFATVHVDNIASQKVFIKNKFKMLRPCHFNVEYLKYRFTKDSEKDDNFDTLHENSID